MRVCVCVYIHIWIYTHDITIIEKIIHEFKGEWEGVYESVWRE